MTNQSKLVLIKTIHTIVWLFFNVVIFYMLYAAITGKLDRWLWIGFGLVGLETLTLLLFKFMCPLTLVARKFSDSRKNNFDIYLPEWLARYNKLIYSGIIVVVIAFTIYHGIKK
jgi:hypothetical protein